MASRERGSSSAAAAEEEEEEPPRESAGVDVMIWTVTVRRWRRERRLRPAAATSVEATSAPPRQLALRDAIAVLIICAYRARAFGNEGATGIIDSECSTDLRSLPLRRSADCRKPTTASGARSLHQTYAVGARPCPLCLGPSIPVIYTVVLLR